MWEIVYWLTRFVITKQGETIAAGSKSKNLKKERIKFQLGLEISRWIRYNEYQIAGFSQKEGPQEKNK